jgi:hypothetical protein
MTICVSTIGWTFVTATKFPWNIFYISSNFGQSIILCPFKPQMWHAYEDVFYGFWFGCVTSVAGFFFLFFACLHTMIHHPTNCAIFVSLPYITLCFCWCYLFSTLWY